MKTEPNFRTATKRILFPTLLLSLCALMAWSGARYALWQSERNTFSANWPLPIDQSARLTTASIAGLPDFVDACEQSTPAVVYIKTTSTQNMRSFNDWFFGDFFQQNPQTVLNSGSGVLISADGYLVTNHHVVHKPKKSRWSSPINKPIPLNWWDKTRVRTSPCSKYRETLCHFWLLRIQRIYESVNGY